MKKPGKKKSKISKVLFAFEILILLIFIAGLYVYGQLDQRLEILEEPAKEFEAEKIVVNPAAPTMTGYTTYALFGIDHRDQNPELNSENSDTIIIASVNNDTKDIKMVSVYRDTLLNIGDGIYAKANAAYAYGGPEQAISMLNKNLDLDIQDYVTIDFNALVTAVDCVDGLDIPMTYAELVHMNNYCIETSQEVGKDYTPIELPERPEDIEQIVGTYHLNGVQATSYCRIRYTATLDMGRTVRQRQTIQRIVGKAKNRGIATIFNMMDEIFPLVKTSLTKNEILQLLPSMIGYALDDTMGFPADYKFSNVRGSIIVPTDLVSNVETLHKFLYGEDIAYVPTPEVQEYSAKILEIVGGEENLQTEQIVTEEETENTNDDNFIWYENPDDNPYNNENTGGDTYDPGWEEPSNTGGETTYPEENDPNTGGGEGNPPEWEWEDPVEGGEGTTPPEADDPGIGGETTPPETDIPYESGEETTPSELPPETGGEGDVAGEEYIGGGEDISTYAEEDVVTE